MHELSVAQAIADTVTDRAEGRPVDRVAVRIGHLRQVVPDSLIFSWELITAGTALEASVLEVEHVQAVIACAACSAESRLDWPIMVCPECSSSDVTLLQGEEFQLTSFDVRQEVG